MLDVYFRQCSILVTARDLAVMAATLANSGVNPVTGEQVVTPYAVARTLSVMTSSGMYDYAGEWVYRVGIPAKSGVGGGIVAALPAQLGLGTFSPRLDSHGNSVRGLKVCEALSSHFELHMLNRSGDVRTCVIADYDIAGITSRRSRQPHEQQILEEHHDEIRVIELVGALTFATIDYVSRRLAGEPAEHAAAHSRFPARAEHHQARGAAARRGHRQPRQSSASRRSSPASKRHRRSGTRSARWTADDAEAAPVLAARRRDRMGRRPDDLSLWRLRAPYGDDASQRAGAARRIGAGGDRRIGQARRGARLSGRPAHHRRRRSGLVVVLPTKRNGQREIAQRRASRLARAGMAFGEMALIEHARSADVWADTAVQCLELSLSAYAGFRTTSGDRRAHHAQPRQTVGEAADARQRKVDLLSAY